MMNIPRLVGIGCDLVDTQRIEKSMQSLGDPFIRRILTPLEYNEYVVRSSKSWQRGVLFVASRFAAKEALSKALGTGVGEKLSFQDVSVLNLDSGKPVFEFSATWLSRAEHDQLNAEVSLSDTDHLAMAMVVVVRTAQ
ncbi:holo-ACP synthase [Limnobacter humi]|uniref:Holo-[acyl-carrier-protein] synthase n=1 Tax=Limnobacter humi TaxID=1778671 RepID=A0ABT1WEJ4_9BURK|nr:holo-ACP synthase [Limnobacter humi]MCQ8895938.1 holo-ACP synthase [Limnobacter humi]